MTYSAHGSTTRSPVRKSPLRAARLPAAAVPRRAARISHSGAKGSRARTCAG
jgi:hypothetical protein